MLQLRPTFSESWYRVQSLKPRLRAGAQISRQFYRGERWYVVRDPAGNQFHRLSDAAYRFIGLLDGRRTISDAWDLVGGQLADDAPTQPEVIQILSQLYSANLLETDITPDATVLLRRHKEMVQRKMQGRMMNVLFPRWGFWDPDNFLRRWMPVMRLLFSRIGALIWLAVVGLTVVQLVPHWTDIEQATKHAFDLQGNPENLVYLYATFVFIKTIHELGHAFACRRFGGECHELGIMLLVLIPTPYVDASTAWGFPNKWHRIFVGCAGMIVELFFASLCAMLWLRCDAQVYPVISQIAYNAMFIASVSTVIFNANPLLRYDGYYILSDLLEIPNLRQKSTEYGMGLIKRHIFRVKAQQPLPPWGQRFWLLLYAIASSIYRVFIGVMIIVLVTFKVPVLGVLMALGGVVTWMVVPVYKVSKYLLLDPELHRKRIRAMAFSAAFAAAVVILVGRVNFPVHVEYAGIVEPDNPLDSNQVPISGMLTTQAAGRVPDGHAGIRAVDGQLVRKGDIIVQLDDPDRQRDYDSDRADLRMVLDYEALHRTDADQTEYNNDLKFEDNLRDKIHRDEDRLEQLKVKAPFDGTLVAPDLDELVGRMIPRGQPIGKVIVLDKLLVRGDVEQKDAELLYKFSGDLNPQIRLAGLLRQVIYGGEVTTLPAGTDQLAGAALGPGAGGEVQVDPRDSKGLRTPQPIFEVRIKLDNAAGQYFPGQRAHVRLTVQRWPLMQTAIRRFLQMIKTHDTGKWL